MTGRISSRSKRLGQSLLEFTLVGIPIMFILISIFEVSRGMWMYHTMAYAAKVGVRYAIVHGFNCSPNAKTNPNNCNVKMGPATNTCDTDNAINPAIAEVVRCAAVGLDPKNTQLTFSSLAGAVAPCTLDIKGGTNPCAATVWPPAGSNDISDVITIRITTTFKSAIALFWPGAKRISFGQFVLGAQSSDRIQY